MKKIMLNIFWLSLFLIAGTVLPAFPGTLNFQGMLQDADGIPVNDTKMIEFRIYDALTGSTPLWSELHYTVVITDGLFAVELGSGTAFPDGLFANENLFITFFVGGEEMSPRQKFLPVPYSLQSASLEGVPLSGLVQQDEDGNASVSGTMTAEAFLGDGSGLNGITAIYDDTFLHKQRPDTLTTNSSVAALNIINSGSGAGMQVDSNGDGVYVYSAGNPTTTNSSAANNGFEVAGAEGNGLFVGRADNYGVNIRYTGNDGINIYSAGNSGVEIGYAGDDAFCVFKAGNPTTTNSSTAKNGFEVAGAEGNGLFVGRADNSGISVYFSGEDGFLVHSAGNPGTTNSSTAKNGFEVAGAEGNGLFVGRADIDGVSIYSAGYDGVDVHYAGSNGFYVYNAGICGVAVYSAGEDGVNIYKVGNPSTTTSSTDKNGFEVAGAEGNGLYVGRADIDGISVYFTGDDGIDIYHADNRGIHIGTSGDDGFVVDTASDNGFHVNSAGGCGVLVNSAYNNGVEVYSAGNDGFFVHSSGNPSATNSDANKNGFEVAGAEGSGLYVGRADNCGVFINSAGLDGVKVLDSTWKGVFANTSNANGEWGLYSDDKIYGSNLTTRSLSTHVRNTGEQPLEAGDLVCLAGGYQQNVLGDDDGQLLVHVRKADESGSQSVFGVVEYKVYIREEVEATEAGTIVSRCFQSAAGNAGYGEYLAVVVFGPAEVKVAAGQQIDAGEKLTVAANGSARSLSDEDSWRIGILGKRHWNLPPAATD